jgi:hypothetical protein
MDTLEELVAKPEVRLALGQLWTRLCNQAEEEGVDVATIMAEEMNKSPKHARMYSLLGIWLAQQD